MNQSPNNQLKEDNLDLILIENLTTLCENINPYNISYVANGKILFQSWMNEMYSFIIKSEYEPKDLDRYIKSCDKILNDISEEKRNIHEHKSDEHLKFTAMYCFNILKSIFSIFIFPLIIKNKSIHWPAKLEKLIKLFIKKNPSNFHKITSTAYTGFKIITEIPPDIKGLYLSITDYESLLNDYESKIINVRKTFIKKQEKLNKEMNRSMPVLDLKEDNLPSGTVEVHYQSPEELLMKDNTPEVVHDNDSAELNLENPNHAEPEVKAPAVEHDTEPEKMAYDDFSPLDVLHKSKCDPMCVPVAKMNDKYFIDHKDLKCYMDACKESNYDRALDSIIFANEDYNINRNSLKIIVTKEDMSNISPELKSEMESSDIQFEVY